MRASLAAHPVYTARECLDRQAVWAGRVAALAAEPVPP
jgi:hypothetical protein